MAKKWIAGAIKRPGALRKHFDIKGRGQKIPQKKLAASIKALKKKARGAKKLSVNQLRLLRQMVLARTLRKVRRKKS